jgi:translation initiation factor 3 subunit J
MAANWDDSDDEWDVSDDDLDDRLGLNKKTTATATTASKSAAFATEEEEDLALKEKAKAELVQKQSNKAKGNALKKKKEDEANRKIELEVARKAMELEEKLESELTIDEKRMREKERQEREAAQQVGDLFGGGMDGGVGSKSNSGMAAGDKVSLVDLKDHLKHAHKVAQCLTGHGKIHLASAFLKEVIQESKGALDDEAMDEIIKICNVIKNEKVQAAKRKVKGQAQKSKKKDKAEEAKAKKMAIELYGDNDNYDEYDNYGAQYEDDFF